MKKKLLLIVSMLAVTLSLAGCASNAKKVQFDYEPDTLAQVAQDKASEYLQYVKSDVEYNYLVTEGEKAGLEEDAVNALKVFSKLDDECGEFIDFENNYTIEEKEDTVVVSIFAKCANEEAQIKAIFVDNSTTYDFNVHMVTTNYDYTEEEAKRALEQNGLYPYKIQEFEIAAVQDFSQKMKAAGVNTIIGMGIVFCVLIFISFIISLLKYVPMIFDKETREKRKAEKLAKKAAAEAETKKPEVKPEESAPAAPQIVDIVNTATGESVMDDSQLVAVITAAVVAASAEETKTYVQYPSNDTLIARPIRRIKRY